MTLQRREKLIEQEKRATEARNEYILSLLACNAFKEKYYQSELSVLVDTMDQTYFDSYRYIFQLYHDHWTAAGLC
jgi:hypothetical protein